MVVDDLASDKFFDALIKVALALAVVALKQEGVL